MNSGMKYKYVLYTLLFFLSISQSYSQLRLDINFDRIELNYGPLFATKDESSFEFIRSRIKYPILKLETARQSYNYKNPDAEGNTYFDKINIDNTTTTALTEKLIKNKFCLMCREAKNSNEDEVEWEYVDENLLLYPIMVNSAYAFLVGDESLVFSYKNELTVLIDDKLCKVAKENCGLENHESEPEPITIEIDTLYYGNQHVTNISAIQINWDSNCHFHTADSIYYYSTYPQFTASKNYKHPNYYQSYEKEKGRNYFNEYDSISVTEAKWLARDIFLNELKNHTFISEDEEYNAYEFIRHFHNNLFIHYKITYEDSTKSKVSGSYVDVFPLLIDDNLASFTFGMAENFLSLKNNDDYVFYHDNKIFKQVPFEELDSTIISKVALSSHDFRVIETKTGYGLKDKYNAEFYIPPIYDSIKVHGYFSEAYKDMQIHLFDKNFELVDIDYGKLKDTYLIEYNLQVLYNNDIFWLNQKGYLQKEFTDYKNPFIACDCCGPYYKYYINRDEDSNFIMEGIAKEYSISENKYTTLKKQEVITGKNIFDDLRFIVSTDSINYNYHWYKKYFPEGMTYIYTKDNKKGLFSRIKNRYENDIVQDSILLDDVDQFYPILDVGHPIKFRVGKKYGYYPFSKQANFIELGDYKHGFARFKLKGNRKGWINLDGEVFMDF